MMNKYIYLILRYTLLCFTLATSLPAFSTSSSASIVVLGDSLSSAYGLPKHEGWVDLLQRYLHQNGFDYNVINASITGETSIGGLTRIHKIFKTYQPRILILELGANDGLRGLPLTSLYSNLSAMIDIAHQNNCKVLLVGMHLPPNYGTEYTQQFHQTYHQVAKHKKTAFVPFMLEGFAEDTRFFLSDRVHPNTHAQAYILKNIWRPLKALLQVKKK